MRIPLLLGALAITLTLVARAQSTSADVTFAVPLNLTNLASDITKVRVTCSMEYGRMALGSAQPVVRKGEVEIPVTARQVVTTAHVVVMIPATAVLPNTVGQMQPYECWLEAFSAAIGWGLFGDQDMTGSFRTTQPVTESKVPQTFQW
jgi:hypothetical protein